ncbi:MAG: hypothetical protein U5N85_15115 [Arcicella sp.]|nr:hypothetical protein [Arcicella sp.]
MFRLSDFEIRIAKTEHLAILYKESLEKRGDVPVNVDYVRDCESLMVYRGNRLIGGCILNNGSIHDLRYFEVYKNPKDKDLLLKTEGIKESDIMEMSCIFSYAKSDFERIAFYTLIFYKTRQFLQLWNKKIIIGGSIHTPIQMIQMRLMRHVILRSTVNETLKMEGHENSVVMIYYCKSSEFVGNALYTIYSFIRDGFTKKRRVPTVS